MNSKQVEMAIHLLLIERDKDNLPNAFLGHFDQLSGLSHLVSGWQCFDDGDQHVRRRFAALVESL